MLSTERSFARRLDLTSLQLFVAVCELGSIGRAAEREFIAASAVSKRLSDLEGAVGTALLYRRPRGVDLTPAGETFLHHARSVLFSLERMQGELSEYALGVRGHVRIHANLSAIMQFLPEDLAGFTSLHPQVKLDLEEHVSSEVVRAVRDGDADIGICSPPGAPGELQSRRYRQDRLVLAVPRGHPLADAGPIWFADSLDHDQIGMHGNSAIDLAMRRAAAAAGKTIQLRIRVTGLDAMCRMVHNRLGVGLLPDRAFELLRQVGDLQAVPLRDDWAVREIDLLARDFDSLPVTARLLVDHLGADAPAHVRPAEAGHPDR
ncbi:MAG TPA: LysR substrate-binding domain-containing protein [Ramlibacter sp.]|jgi:DNA-binding transcriptional LysR family regulator|uniref:LysR substrate-binding domain-containing protein n=1 Tax=Ramlibacter sp. TaxID=1917967 RepID=UPI002D676E61|nr:LysR substrate-binding domain-containing protein [Ramlibacter sp.]HZY20361.1 LysR substrate-binding domain-containing protein [Ramlibacter sp.]